MRRRAPISAAAVIILAAVLWIIVSVGASLTPEQDSWPVLVTTTPSNPVEEAAIKDVLERSYDVNAQALVTFDISQYPTVYTNEPAVPLTPDQAAFLAQVRAAQSSAAGSLSSDGFLDWKTSQVLDRQRGTLAFEQAEAEARKEGRQVTATDFSADRGIVGVPSARDSVSLGKTTFSYKEITIAGSQAMLTYDDGGALCQAFFVKTSAGWRIAGLHVIRIHF